MVNPNRFYTYAYLREDRTPYYIGKGSNDRAFNSNRRLPVPKDKNRILFLKQNLTEEEAFKHEKYMIDVLGRKDLGTGILRNLTDGGDSPPIFTGHTKESKIKISKSLRGRILGPGMSNEAKLRLSKRNKNLWIKPPLHVSQYSFTSPDGIIYSGTNIKQFSIDNNLSLYCLYSLRSYKQYKHKGWTLTNPSKIKNLKPVSDWNSPGSGNKYCLLSPNGEYYYVIIGELSLFANNNNLLPNGVSRLINEKRKTYRGWKLVK